MPVLDDGVVWMRPPEPGDVDAVFATCRDEEAARYTTLPWPYERHHAVEWVEESTRCWAEGVRASFVVLERATGELVGNLGVVRLDHDRDAAEVGYLVARAHRGRGSRPVRWRWRRTGSSTTSAMGASSSRPTCATTRRSESRRRWDSAARARWSHRSAAATAASAW